LADKLIPVDLNRVPPILLQTFFLVAEVGQISEARPMGEECRGLKSIPNLTWMPHRIWRFSLLQNDHDLQETYLRIFKGLHGWTGESGICQENSSFCGDVAPKQAEIQLFNPHEKCFPHNAFRSGANRSQFCSGRGKRQCYYAYVP